MSFTSHAFTGTDGTAVETADTGLTGSGAVIISNRAHNPNASSVRYYDSVIPSSADYKAGADVYIASTANVSGGPTARHTATTASLTCYHGRQTGNSLQIIKFVADAATQLGPSVTNAVGTGSTPRLEIVCEGSSISLYADGALKIGPITDTQIPGPGRVGFRITGGANTGHIDNLTGDYLTAAGITASSAATLGAVTGSAVGTVAIAASSAAALGAVTGSAVGTVIVTGNSVATLGDVTAATPVPQALAFAPNNPNRLRAIGRPHALRVIARPFILKAA